MRHRRSPFKFKLKKQAVYSIVAIGLFGFAALVLVSMFFPEGRVLERTNAIFSLYFGWGRVLLVFSILQLAMLFAKIKISLAKTNVVLGYFFIVFALLGLSQSGSLGITIFQIIYSLIPFSIFVFLFYCLWP